MRLPMAVLALLLVAACAAPRPSASPGARPAGAPGGRGPGVFRAPSLFISPAGEPFRPGPGGAPLIDWFSGADSDHDGRLSLAEFTADHMRFFRILDLDGDGSINSDEADRYETQIAPEILPSAFRTSGAGQGAPATAGAGARGGGRGGGGGGGRGAGGPGLVSGGAPGGAGLTGAAQFSVLDDPEPVRAADGNLDLKVTLAEWTAVAQKRFAQLDENHDGFLTLSELHWPRGGGQPAGGRRG